MIERWFEYGTATRYLPAMHQSDPLIDRLALSRNRLKAEANAMFLHDAALDEIKDRLSIVNRSFTHIGIVTPFPHIWARDFPGATFVSDSETLAFDAGTYDLIVHAMCLHWNEDPVGQAIQCRRALKPDGLFLAVTLGGQTLSELRSVLGQAESDVTGGLSPRIVPMAELRELGALLQRANFALPVADSTPLVVEYADVFAVMRDLRAMGEGNALANRMRNISRREIFLRAAMLYAEHFPAPQGRVRATFDLIFLTGWAPDQSQPQPLRPGSAQTRLSDALKTTETKLSD